MKQGWMTVAAEVLLAACVGAPLPRAGGRRVQPVLDPPPQPRRRRGGSACKGRVELMDDESGVRAIRPGGYLLLLERGTRCRDRRALFTPAARTRSPRRRGRAET